MTIRQVSILKQILNWFKANAAVIIAFWSLSWQISSKVGGFAYLKVSNFVDSANATAAKVNIMQGQIFEINRKEVMNGIAIDSLNAWKKSIAVNQVIVTTTTHSTSNH